MGFFTASQFDADVEKATSETNTDENWSIILDVCDKVKTTPRGTKECLKSIMKRMGHEDPHVVMQAITLLDACANNCGKTFHLDIASREFETEFKRLHAKAQPKVALKMRQVLKNWAEKDFKDDPELSLIPALYAKMRQEGLDFGSSNDKSKPTAKVASVPKDPNVVSSQQEEDDIAKAIELSLKETKSSPKQKSIGSANAAASSVAGGGASAYPSLYPSFSGGGGSLGSINSTGGATLSNSGAAQPEPRKVRALYDFEAAEENELTFVAGEIIHVLDDSDQNWWKGFNQRGNGLFPSNFVTADLSVDPERLDINQQHKSTASSSAKKSVQFEEDARELQQKTEAAAAAAANQTIEIDETKIDRLLHLLHEANPEDPSQDSDEMLRLEQEVHQMGPLIDAELERVDRKHAQLTQLSSDLVDAINLYHSLMRDDRTAIMGGAFMHGAMTGQNFNFPGASVNPQMMFGYGSGNAGIGFPSGPASMTHHSFGATAMHPLPFANAGNMPGGGMTSAGGTAVGYPSTNNVSMSQIPMQFQNGHSNATQLNSLASHMSSPVNQGQHATQAQQMFNTSTQQQHQQQSNNYQMLPPEQQLQQQQQYPPQISATTTVSSMPVPPHQQQQQQQQQPPQQPQQTIVPPLQQHQQQPQYISTQHQQGHLAYMPQQQPQPHPYAAIPNGPQTYMTPSNSTMLTQTQQPLSQQQQPQQLNNHNNNHHNNNNPNHSIEQFSQLQHQMAAMSMGHNQQQQQPIANNIPIYQQQR